MAKTLEQCAADYRDAVTALIEARGAACAARESGAAAIRRCEQALIDADSAETALLEAAAGRCSDGTLIGPRHRS